MYLLEHQNRYAPLRDNGKRGWYWPTRRNEIRGIVMHTPEALEDYAPPDDTAENVARYFSNVDRAASAHVVIDSDTIVECLPDDHTAFHAAEVNSKTLGVEVGYRALSWTTMPSGVRAALLTNAARWIAPRVVAYRIDLRVITSQAGWEAGARGFLEHSMTEIWRGQAGRRSDPGRDFPWEELFDMIRAQLSEYVDTETWPAYAHHALEGAITNGIMIGDQTADGARYWHPEQPITRADMAVVLDRLGLLEQP